MPTNFCLVVYAAQRNACELASQRAGNRAAQRCLANPMRSNEAQDLSLDFTVGVPCATGKPLAQMAYREELNDAFFDVLQPVMILLKHAASGFNIEAIAGACVPGGRSLYAPCWQLRRVSPSHRASCVVHAPRRISRCPVLPG